MKRFSIIMAAYNSENEIERAIQSVLNQTFKDYEFIVVDDASKDNTNNIVSKYSNIKLITHKVNKRAGGARNSGLNIASGEYIIFLDSDDKLANKFVLEEIDKKIGEDKPDLVYLGFEAIGESMQGDFLPNEHNSVKENRMVEWKYENVWDICWNRKFLNDCNIRFVENRYFEDFVFYYKGVLKSSSYKFIEFPAITYTSSRPESMTNLVNPKKIEDLYYNMQEFIKLYEEIEPKYRKYMVESIRSVNKYIDVLLNKLI